MAGQVHERAYPAELGVPSGEARHSALMMFGDIPLPSGYRLNRRDVGIDVYRFSYLVKTPEGEHTGIVIDSYSEGGRDPRFFTAGWRKAPERSVFLDAANQYFAAVAQAEGNPSPTEVGVYLAEEFGSGDIFEDTTVTFPVDEDKLKQATKGQFGANLEEVEMVKVYTPSGTFWEDNKDYMRVSPTFSDESSRQPVIDALHEVFRATTTDEALVPAFQEALDVVVTDEFQR